MNNWYTVHTIYLLLNLIFLNTEGPFPAIGEKNSLISPTDLVINCPLLTASTFRLY